MISMSMDSAARGTGLTALFANPPDDGGVSVGRVASLITFLGPRAENQDRAFVALMSPQAGQARFVAAVLDGMGGMEEGAKAASLAASTFLQSLATSFTVDLGAALAMAISEANAAVWATLQGRGGTTLTAVAMSGSGQCLAVHVGDSRLYAGLPRPGQLTTDDTPRGLFGSDLGFTPGGLVRFVGAGDRAVFQSLDLTNEESDSLLLTTDGFHGAGGEGLSSLLVQPRNATGAALARLGQGLRPGDNATAVLISRSRAMAELGHAPEGALLVTSTTEPRDHGSGSARRPPGIADA
ncbi:MAG TPA: protein phosphatase 2C domain-containing protein [Phenylobacterium sp.]|nr:protein phosphatase 2C domain-containing protein [Phenylobacterium sp.]